MKYKTIKISEELHKQLKGFCDMTDKKLNSWCETQLSIRLSSELKNLNDLNESAEETIKHFNENF